MEICQCLTRTGIVISIQIQHREFGFRVSGKMSVIGCTARDEARSGELCRYAPLNPQVVRADELGSGNICVRHYCLGKSPCSTRNHSVSGMCDTKICGLVGESRRVMVAFLRKWTWYICSH